MRRGSLSKVISGALLAVAVSMGTRSPAPLGMNLQPARRSRLPRVRASISRYNTTVR